MRFRKPLFATKSYPKKEPLVLDIIGLDVPNYICEVLEFTDTLLICTPTQKRKISQDNAKGFISKHSVDHITFITPYIMKELSYRKKTHT